MKKPVKLIAKKAVPSARRKKKTAAPTKSTARMNAKPTKRTKTSTFDEAAFWSLIARVETKSRGKLSAACAAFRAELEALDDGSLVAAEAIFHDVMRKLHDWDVWQAAEVLHGGCSDDGFWDFRAGIIALGRDVYERTLRDPDSLAAIEDIANRTLFEGFQYVPGRVLEARHLRSKGLGHHNKKPTGVAIQDDDDLPARYPKLTERFDD